MAAELATVASTSRPSLRQRAIQAKVRSTIQRLGRTAKPCAMSSPV